VAALLAGCTSTRINTVPEDATIEANGDDISDTGEVKDRIGFKDHQVTVRKKGYKPKTVAVPRNQTNTVIKWSALVGSIACASGSSCCACGLGALLGNAVAPPTFAGACLSLVGGGDPVSALAAAIVASTATQDMLTVPCMGLCTLAGSWPLLGLMLPLLWPKGAEEITVELEKKDAAEPEPAASPEPAAPAVPQPELVPAPN